jgi:hypothetical protein
MANKKSLAFFIGHYGPQKTIIVKCQHKLAYAYLP